MADDSCSAERKKIRGLNLPGTPWVTSACRGTPLLYIIKSLRTVYNIFCRNISYQCDVFLTVHHRIISSTNFNAQFSLFVNNMFVTLFSSTCFDNVCMYVTCPSSGGKIVFTQHLVSSLSVNFCPVHWLRAEFFFLKMGMLMLETCRG